MSGEKEEFLTDLEELLSLRSVLTTYAFKKFEKKREEFIEKYGPPETIHHST